MALLFALLARVAPAGAADCNLNGVDDAADIAAGVADCNRNGVPDPCELFPVAFVETRVPVGAAPGAIATGELTGDQFPDLAVANPGASTITIFEGAAGGVFTSPDTVNVGMRPEAVTTLAQTGLIIGSGSTIDLVVANGDSNTVSVLRNAGDGTFSSSSFALAGHPNGVATGDLTGFDPEIVVTTRDGAMQGLWVLVNDGSGGFSSPGGFLATGMQPRAVLLRDLNGDGLNDALVANRGDGTVTFARNNMGMSFVSMGSVASVGDPVAIAVADIDVDGDLDLAVLSGTDAGVHLFLNDGAGVFTAGAVVPAAAGGAALQLVDIDANGAADVVAVSTATDAVVIALNDGTGGFGAPVAVPVGDGPVDVVSLDADGDGRIDLVVTNSLSGDLSVLRATGPAARDCDASGVLDACEPARRDCNANGVADTCDAASAPSFGPPVFTPAAGDGPPLAVGDLDGDGRPEVVFRRSGPKLVVDRGMADGSLAERGAFDLPGNPARVLLVDVDGDGDRDFVVTSAAASAVYVLRNDGTGAVGATDTYALASQPSPVVAGEFTGDGVLDLVAGNNDVNPLTVLPGTGGGAFGAPSPVALTGRARELVAGDVDGDGDTDIVALLQGPGGTALTVVRNDGGTLAPEPPILAELTPSVLIGLSGADFDGDGDLDLAVLELNFASGGLRLRLAPRTSGAYAFGQALPFGQGVAAAPIPGFLIQAAVTDLDGDGHLDLAYPGFFRSAVTVFRNHGDGTFELPRSIPAGKRLFAVAAGDVTGDGAMDLVATAASADQAVVVVPGLGRPAVDVNANGVPDCQEETRCGDCADDEGDGLFDAADPDCAGGAMVLRRISVRPAHGRKPARAKLVADVPAALTLDPAATALGVTVAAAETYCGTPGLRRKGRRALRLVAADRTLTGLVVQTLARNRGLRARAALAPLDPSPNAGDVVRVWLVGGGQAFRGEATLRKKGKTLVGP